MNFAVNFLFIASIALTSQPARAGQVCDWILQQIWPTYGIEVVESKAQVNLGSGTRLADTRVVRIAPEEKWAFVSSYGTNALALSVLFPSFAERHGFKYTPDDQLFRYPTPDELANFGANPPKHIGDFEPGFRFTPVGVRLITPPTFLDRARRLKAGRVEIPKRGKPHYRFIIGRSWGYLLFPKKMLEIATNRLSLYISVLSDPSFRENRYLYMRARDGITITREAIGGWTNRVQGILLRSRSEWQDEAEALAEIQRELEESYRGFLGNLSRVDLLREFGELEGDGDLKARLAVYAWARNGAEPEITDVELTKWAEDTLATLGSPNVASYLEFELPLPVRN